MNEDPAYLRAAIRGRVVPALEAAVGRGVRSTLARTAANLREDADFLEALAAAAAADVVAIDATTPEALLRADALAGLPRPVAGRARFLLGRAGMDGRSRPSRLYRRSGLAQSHHRRSGPSACPKRCNQPRQAADVPHRRPVQSQSEAMGQGRHEEGQ